VNREYTIRIERRKNAQTAPEWQSFVIQADDTASVADALRTINERVPLVDADGNPCSPIAWECSCLQRKCGACAMRINTIPKLACAVFLREFRHCVVTLEPLGKFPVIADLIVDRSALFEQLQQARLWLESEPFVSEKRREAAYHSAQCLLCGCCLEICPNFNVKNNFGGAALAVNAYRLLEQSSGAHRQDMAKRYRDLYYNDCGHSLACHAICPAGLPVEDLLARSNAIAVWGR
jgi:succinate dehydrogenase / fumarate reductase iron-sulfur subunit